MKQRIIILFANPYNMTDEKGKNQSGCSVSYLMTDSLDPVVAENGAKGMRAAKGTIPEHDFPLIVDAPALYDAELNYAVGGDGKPTIKLGHLTYVSPIKLASITSK